MKKTYITPSVSAYDVKPATILAESVDILSGGTSSVGDSNAVLSKDAFGIGDLEDANNTLLDLLDQ